MRSWTLPLVALALAACGRHQPAPLAAMGSPFEFERERCHMVEFDIEASGVNDPLVLDAMREVPRHLFVPRSLAKNAYEDRPLPIGEGQTISQPYIVALMTEALELDGTSRVLEIGTGSGYQAAVLAEITPYVWSIEIVEPLGRNAAQLLHELGYGAIKCRVGDGYRGWPEEAPFDAIIVTAAPGFVPSALFDQLAPNGRLVIPVGAQDEPQKLLLVTKDEQGRRHESPLALVRFVPMTGEAMEKR